MTNYIKTHYFTFNENSNGGEQLLLTTYFYKSQTSGEISTIHELTLNSYENKAGFTLSGILTPDILRKLADELDKEMFLIP